LNSASENGAFWCTFRAIPVVNYSGVLPPKSKPLSRAVVTFQLAAAQAGWRAGAP